MQFVVIAKDFQDKDALSRRIAVRAAHIELSNAAIKKGQQIFAVATLNENGAMCGSVMVVDFASRADVDRWLKTEPYVTGKVWEYIDVFPCKVGPSFEGMISTSKADM